MILVTGATGNFGNAAIQYMLKKGTAAANIAALVRDEARASGLKAQGITIRKGNYDSYNSLLDAMDEVEKLLLVSGSDPLHRTKQHQQVIDAARESGVKHIAYTSYERKNDSGDLPIAAVAQSHLATEAHLKSSGLSYTILRNNLYTDFISIFIGERVLESGISFPAGDGRFAPATRNDMAEAAAVVMTENGHENRSYGISGVENISFQDVAAILSKLSRTTVSYTPDEEAYKTALRRTRIPEVAVDAFVSFAQTIKAGEFEARHTDLDKLLKRKPVSVMEYFEQVRL
jgi:NAD(P)H dehydrogenase (quinone)